MPGQGRLQVRHYSTTLPMGERALRRSGAEHLGPNTACQHSARGVESPDLLGSLPWVLIPQSSHGTVLQSITSSRGYQAFFRGRNIGTDTISCNPFLVFPSATCVSLVQFPAHLPDEPVSLQ